MNVVRSARRVMYVCAVAVVLVVLASAGASAGGNWNVPGQWIRLYVDAKDTKIAFSGKDASWTVSVDDGVTALLKTELVVGGDRKTPITHTNINNPLNPTVMQGKTLSCSFKDGEKTISLEGSNSYFNQSMKSSGMF